MTRVDLNGKGVNNMQLSSRVFKPGGLSVAMMAAFAHGSWALADDAPVARQLDEMVVKADKPAVPANLPATTEGATATQISESINAVTTAETLNYLPSIHVRERYIGDRNGILVMRVNSSIASAQTTVYADDLLLSNFLNNSFSTAPRCGMVSPEEIDRVDVMYGPFSALYPGNSAGGVVQITTHMAERFEAHAKLDAFGEQFALYGTDKDFSGGHGSASLGNKVDNWSFWINLDRLDNYGHPMTFGAAVQAKPAGAPAFTPVSGEFHDIDTSGKPRIITSAIGADHTVQDNGKFKLAYDFSHTLRATYTLGIWRNNSDTSIEGYLRDASGNSVFNTTSSGAGKYVKFAGDANYYTLSGTSPGRSESEHFMHGLLLKSNSGGVWDWEAVASLYDENKDIASTASNTASLSDDGFGTTRPGQLTIADGTGWYNLDLRGEWRPGGDLRSAHQVSLGFHTDRYTLKSETDTVSDWLSSTSGTLSSNSYGKTQTAAVYLQDAWQFAPAWKLVAGGRLEHWKAFDGSNYNAANANPYKQLNYLDRSSTDFSPKLALSFQASADWALRGAYGKGVRYPTVAEMFQTYTDATGAKVNDPNLKPEQVNSIELAAERALANGLLRVSLFHEDKRDALISQTDTVSVPGKTISSIQNVDEVRTNGVETALETSDLWIRGFDLNGSVTYVDSTIVRDSRNPGLEGTDQPRIPQWRATVVGTYHASDRLSYSLSYRYSGPQHNALYNTTTKQYNDVNPDVYGAVSSYSVFDAKLLYKLAKQWTAALGVNNIGNYKYYVNPNPYPQRTLFASVKFDY
jgi:iron complex outermembrane receptor protein